MAMRVCIYCKQDVTYERENRNMLANGVVGFWTNPVTGQASCPSAPVDSNGQQLHNVGDVHTPPVHDPNELEKFLDGTYVPPVPAEPCGDIYGMSETGEFLQCGLDKGHDGACEAGTPVDVTPKPGDSPDPDGTDSQPVASFDVNDLGDGKFEVSLTIPGCGVNLTFDTGKVQPEQIMQMLALFPPQVHKVVVSIMTGIDPALIEQAQQAEAEAAKPEVPKLLEDLGDIEKFLNDDDT
jgi:hypothetical protein